MSRSLVNTDHDYMYESCQLREQWNGIYLAYYLHSTQGQQRHHKQTSLRNTIVIPIRHPTNQETYLAHLLNRTAAASYPGSKHCFWKIHTPKQDPNKSVIQFFRLFTAANYCPGCSKYQFRHLLMRNGSKCSFISSLCNRFRGVYASSTSAPCVVCRSTKRLTLRSP